MDRLALGFAVLLGVTGAGFAASAVNLDAAPQTIVVTEGGERNEVVINAGQSEQFCFDGCFVTFPNGDREVLTGAETIEISGGAGHIR